MDRGDWQATVHGAVKSWIQWSDFSPHLLVLQSLGPGAKAALKAKVEIRSPQRCFPAPAVGQKEATALPLPPCLPWARPGLAGHTRFRQRRLKIGL